MKKTIHPNSVIMFAYNNKQIDANIMCSLIGFVFAFFLCIFIIASLLCLDGMDLMSSFSGAATAVSNVGPGFGKIIGPAGNFSSLSDFSKWVLSIGMLFGRLEITTLVIILVPYFWKK